MAENEKINAWTFEETVKTAENLMEVEKNMYKWDVLRHLRDFAEYFKHELEQYQVIGTVEKIKEYKEIADNMNAVSMSALCALLNKLKKYEEIGTPEEYRAAIEQLKAAKEDIRKLLCSEYGSSCQFCIQNNNEDAMCSKICGSGSWCCENAAWKSHRLEMLKNEIKQ